MVFDHEGQICASAQKEIRQIYPHPGWVEHDPEEIWQTQVSVALLALEQARIRPTDIAGVGIANQRETIIVWDRETGKPIYNAIVWQDRRTAKVCD
jgi:glycerol kinase